VRTADPSHGLRSAITRGLEVLFRRVWPHAGARVNALPVVQLAARLQEAGFAVTAAPCWRGTPFANVLLVARRGGGRAHSPDACRRSALSSASMPWLFLFRNA
jgi:hypothetical protein